MINKDLEKTPYEVMAIQKPPLKYFHVFGAKLLAENLDLVIKLIY